jgi:RimJ/RimL family protein N-acetyltransferase
MRRPFLVGSRVYLRSLDTDDLDSAYLQWVNDSETVRFLAAGRFPTTRAGLERHLRSSGRQAGNLFLAIVRQDDDRHIGNIRLGPIDWVNRVGPIGILIGEPDCHGKGYGREAVSLVAQHAFEQLGLNKVTAGAHGDHAAYIRMFTAAGFAIEGSQRQHLYRDGQYRDNVLMALLRDEFLARATRT